MSQRMQVFQHEHIADRPVDISGPVCTPEPPVTEARSQTLLAVSDGPL